MMKTLAIILFTMTAFGQTSINNVKILDTVKTESCFSKANFDSVYKYINVQIKKSNTTFSKYDNYELYLNDTTEISFKKDGYTLSKVIKEKGVFSLAKRKKDNEKILKETNEIFCKILLLIDKELKK